MQKRVRVYSFSADLLVLLYSEPVGYINAKGAYLASGIPEGAKCVGLRQGKDEFQVDLLMEHPDFDEVKIDSFYLWGPIPAGKIGLEYHESSENKV